MLLQDNDFPIQSRHIRPAGVAVGTRMTSYQLRFDPERFARIDSWLMAKFGRQVVKLDQLEWCVDALQEAVRVPN